MNLPSRNAPCPCGSGKRYKHCHGGPGSPDPFLGVPEGVIGINRDRRTGQTRIFRDDLVLRRLHETHPQLAKSFDERFGRDIQDVSTELAIASSLVEVGTENASKAKDAEVLRRLGTVLNNAVNSVVSALEVARQGYSLQSGILLRSVLEGVAVVADIVVNEESIERYRAHRYSPVGVVTRANKVLGMVGPLYGALSNFHTHVTASHEVEYPLDSTGPDAVAALRVIKAAGALVGLSAELLFQRSVGVPRYWKRLPNGALTFSPDVNELQFLKEFPRLSTDEPTNASVRLAWTFPAGDM